MRNPNILRGLSTLAIIAGITTGCNAQPSTENTTSIPPTSPPIASDATITNLDFNPCSNLPPGITKEGDITYICFPDDTRTSERMALEVFYPISPNKTYLTHTSQGIRETLVTDNSSLAPQLPPDANLMFRVNSDGKLVLNPDTTPTDQPVLLTEDNK